MNSDNTKGSCKECDFSKSVRNPYAKHLKKQVTLRLGTEVIAYFKKRSENPIGLLGVSWPVALALSVLRGRDAREPRVFEPFEEPNLAFSDGF